MIDFDEQRRRLVERLAKNAASVDTADMLPKEQLDALAHIGLYGVFAPESLGGLGLGVSELCQLVEELASGCLATTFVWLQHRGLVMTLSAGGTPAALRDITQGDNGTYEATTGWDGCTGLGSPDGARLAGL